MSDRYAGKPFLQLLDSYVLDAIGALDARQRATLTGMEPRLAQVYGTGGRWQDIVAAQMKFPVSMPTRIVEIWRAGSEKMREAGQAPDPLAFARQFVDANFDHG